MEITIIHGQAHKGSTYHVTERLREKLSDRDTVVHEYFMLKESDTPSFCTGCFRCILEGEHFCPQAAKVKRIEESMLSSDIIIIDSPTYCFEMTGQLKTLFDHFGYLWMSHRPRKEMFSKIGIVVSTAAGAGTGRVTQSIAKQLSWWGIPKVYRMKVNVSATSWDEVSPKIMQQIEERTSAIEEKAKRQTGKKAINLKNMFIFTMIRKMQKGNTWNMVDKDHWKNNLWLENARPWRG